MMIFYRRLAAGLAVCVALSAANARQVLAQPMDYSSSTGQGATLTLAAAINLAFEKSPNLAVARREIEASEGVIEQSDVLPNPELSYLIEDTTPAYQTSTLQINQPIELGGKRSARRNAARQSREIATAQFTVQRAEVKAAVTTAFFDFIFAQEQLKLAREALSLAHRASEVAANRVLAGKASPVEETKAGVAEAASCVDLLQAQGELNTARNNLSATWGGAPRFEQVDGTLDALPEMLAHGELEKRISESPKLNAARLEAGHRQAISAVERTRRIPDVTVSFGIKRIEEFSRTSAVIGLSIPLPIFNSNRGNLNDAIKREEKAIDEMEAVQNRLWTDVYAARERLKISRTQSETLKRDVLPGAQNAYEAASVGFQLGKFGILDVLDAQRTLFQAKLQYLRINAEAHRAAADIERLLGDGENETPLPEANP